jgi:hypothetical protein
MRQAGHVTQMRDKRCAYKVSEVKPEGMNHLEDPSVEGEDCIKVDLRK